MKSFLNELEAHAGKKAYQTYTMQHGIEKLTLLVPLENTAVFEEEFGAIEDKSKSSLLEVVTKHNGKVRG